VIKELIANGSLIIAFMLFGGNIIKERPFDLPLGKKTKIVTGLLYGILGSILMTFTIKVTDTFIVDMRHIALIIATSLGGGISAVICATLMGLSRLIFFGINKVSLSALAVLVVQTIVFILVTRIKKWSFDKKYLSMTLLSLTISLYAFAQLLGIEQLITVSISYGVIFVLTSICSLYTLLYIQKTNEAFRKLKMEAKMDHITGLNNVRKFDEYFSSLLDNIEKNNRKLSVLMIDIDYFKKINDAYGHSSGDMVLQKFALLLKENARKFDFIARKGGEEFVVLLLDCHLQKAIEVAERIRLTVENTNFEISDGKKINITISIGVATYPDTTTNKEDLLEKADSELYYAKWAGRNRVSPSLTSTSSKAQFLVR
jgi:diguanylate cyclase